MSGYDCMTPEELALWQEAANQYRTGNGVGTASPCTDCPMWFHLQEKAAGRCERRPQATGRPAMTEMEKLSSALRRERRRQQAAASRRYRAKLRAEVEAVRLARAS